MNRNISSFGALMTRTAQGNQITQVIGLFVIVIFAGYVTEAAKWPDMMNVKFFTDLLGGFAAMLAFIAVTLPGFVCLRFPLRAITGDGATLPQGRIVAAHLARLPIGAALLVAKVKAAFVFTYTPRFSFKWTTAKIARLFNSRDVSLRVVLSDKCSFLPLRKTTLATKVMFVTSDLIRVSASKRLTTLLTGYLGITRPSRMVITNGVFAFPFSMTFVVTKLPVGIFQPIRISFQYCATISARSFYLTLPVGVIYARCCFRLPRAIALTATKMILGGLDVIWSSVERRVAVVALYFHLIPQKKTPRRVAQKCDLKSYVRMFVIEYIVKAFSGNNSLGRISIIPQLEGGGQS